jgi:hypothetical protein
MGRRLEDVRKLVGAPNLKAFHAMLAEKVGDEADKAADDFPSYAAALTYHTPPFRDPPTIYLERIAARFPSINLAWLVTGGGEPRIADEHAKVFKSLDPRREALREAFQRGFRLRLRPHDRAFEAMEETLGQLMAATLDKGDLWGGWHGWQRAEHLLAERIGRAIYDGMQALGLLRLRDGLYQDEDGTWKNVKQATGASVAHLHAFTVRMCIAIEAIADAEGWVTTLEDDLRTSEQED